MRARCAGNLNRVASKRNHIEKARRRLDIARSREPVGPDRIDTIRRETGTWRSRYGQTSRRSIFEYRTNRSDRPGVTKVIGSRRPEPRGSDTCGDSGYPFTGDRIAKRSANTGDSCQSTIRRTTSNGCESVARFNGIFPSSGGSGLLERAPLRMRTFWFLASIIKLQAGTVFFLGAASASRGEKSFPAALRSELRTG